MSPQIDVETIVKNYLVEHGYDGLVHPWGDCACLVSDLMPCDGCSDADFSGCLAGHRVSIAPASCDHHGDNCSWHIVAGRRPNPPQPEAAGS